MNLNYSQLYKVLYFKIHVNLHFKFYMYGKMKKQLDMKKRLYFLIRFSHYTSEKNMNR